MSISSRFWLSAQLLQVLVVSLSSGSGCRSLVSEVLRPKEDLATPHELLPFLRFMGAACL
jgi:hypothetical protein